VIPNDDPAKGDILPLLESEFLVSLEASLQQHANAYKVWNLSLGTDTVCSLDEFSTLAEELDNLQEKYKVSFVISAGNYERRRSWISPELPASYKPQELPRLLTAFSGSLSVPCLMSITRRTDRRSITLRPSPGTVPARIM
jgi:hypothetical protein